MTSAPAAARASAACSGVAPVIVRSCFLPVSKTMQADDRQSGGLGGLERNPGFVEVAHGLDHQRHRTGIGQGLGLLGEGGSERVFINLAAEEHLAAGADRGEDVRPVRRHRDGKFRPPRG